MEYLHYLLHIDQQIPLWLELYGSSFYWIIFLIIFCETGLVVMPFLPGDSLLFALGALTAMTDKGLDFQILSSTLMVAAFLGDNVNYTVGNRFGELLMRLPERPWLRKNHVYQTQDFIHKNGKWAIVLARFVPIVRTFAPFVAGLGRMKRSIFILYSVSGALIWTQSFLWLGRAFGSHPLVKENFSKFVVAIIIVSVLPLLVAFLKMKLKKSSV